VVDGGRDDGVAGIIAGLLVMRWLGPKFPVRIGAFRCEESSNFARSTLGSGLITGSINGLEQAHAANREGKTLGEIFSERGYSLNPERIRGIKAYLELHIEQGKVLQEYNQHIGVVTSIAGPRRFNLYIEGLAEHSGATPMTMRKDALCAAAELILEIERIGLAESVHHSVATVGVVDNSPNAINVIPGAVRLQVDIRGIERASLDDMEQRITEAGKSICVRRGLGFITEDLASTRPVDLNRGMQDQFDRILRDLGISHRRMISGAGHDAMHFADLGALLFIPCRDGLSHNKKEFAAIESICEGARVLYSFISGDPFPAMRRIVA
jgi:N-carbamoyl-L-amino-acid hydrolase